MLRILIYIAAMACVAVLATDGDLRQMRCSEGELFSEDGTPGWKTRSKAEQANGHASELSGGVPDVLHGFPLRRLAFGSCFKQETEKMSQRAREVLREKQISVLKTIISKAPDCWIWTGDAGYAGK